MAWEKHYLALNANQRVGGKALGIDADGYIHFRHTLASFDKAILREHEHGIEVDAEGS
jgi:hypothetical protein